MSVSERLIPAAQYLRMSTDYQRYSLDNQSDAIAEYAARRGFLIVKTYRDAARTGVILRNRLGLQALLRDVLLKPDYKAVLVYDVSRWGRFQDVDESAHYEFICKSAGVKVEYCAEQFLNDGTVAGAVMKNLKRAMAAEYSRELGEKVVRGKHRIVQMGFSVGSVAPYGMRRLLLSGDGKRRRLLQRGEQKFTTTDRVTLVPGPRHEVAVVRMMFQRALHDPAGAAGVARFLNTSKIKSVGGREWSIETVRNMLRNPKYVGTNIWGKLTGRLYERMRPAARDKWSVKAGAFTPIVDQRTFDKVQKRIRARRWTDLEILDHLRDVWRREGKVNHDNLTVVTHGPSPSTVRSHFGSLRKALELAGCPVKLDVKLKSQRNVCLRRLHRRTINELVRMFPHRLKAIAKARSGKRLLVLDGQQIAVLIASPRPTSFRRVSWSVHPANDEWDLPAVCCLLGQDYRSVLQIYGFPGFPKSQKKFDLKPGGDRLKHGIKINNKKEICKVMAELVQRRLTTPSSL